MIICTAGHVDHGKTSLLEALTGKHTAHTPEEKKRGLTIELGYAYLPIENEVLGFIDVPGHQKFLPNMLAGLGGIDYAMLVIAADEGIKPQTVEHLGILRLLHFKQIMVVISKADRSNLTEIDRLIAEVQQQFPILADSPFFITSSQTGQGIEVLKQHLISLNHNNSKTAHPFRYALDRIFHIKGAGLVVTGTAVSGVVNVGDELYLSNGKTIRVKAIHAQNKPSEQGQAGQRLALNIANVEKEHIARGDWLTTLKPEFATDRISVTLEADQSLKENSIVHLYHYVRHITGKLNLLDCKGLAAGQKAVAEVILDEPLHMAIGDKLILRAGDDSHTLAGAEVLEIQSPKRHKRSDKRLDLLKNLQTAKNYAERTACYVAEKALSLDSLMWAEQRFVADFGELGYPQYANFLFSQDFKQGVTENILEKLADYHTQHNDQLGVTKARLHRIAALNQPEKLVFAFIDELIEQGQLAQTRGWVHLPEHRIAFDEKEQALWAEIQPIFAATNQALWVRDIASQLSVDETEMRNLLYKAGKLGYLVPIVRDRFLTHEQITEFATLIKAFIQQHGEISVNQLRDEIQYGRKLTVQLIEYFDRSGFLRRKGNVHLLRDSETY